MRLTLAGSDPVSNPTGSPTVYRTDRGSRVLQRWGGHRSGDVGGGGDPESDDARFVGW